MMTLCPCQKGKKLLKTLLTLLGRPQGYNKLLYSAIYLKCFSGDMEPHARYNSTQDVVPGFEDDYSFTPSPESPAYSPITPIRFV